ncbi:MAG TPA: hypothetical protein VFB45_15475 [Pseudolabrys sp.]|nr:hypothetical protein [Pseudolabrys sp.]
MIEPAPAMGVAPFPRERFLKFCSKVKILTKDFGLMPLEMLGTQIYILNEICKGLAEGCTTFVILKARQLGISTFFVVLDIFWAMEHRGLAGSFATHDEQSREQFRNIIEVLFANLPKGFRIGYEKHNRSMLILKNSSLFRYLVAGVKKKTKAGLGRSGASNFLHATEVAFWGDEEDLKELRATLSTHYPHRLQVYETTANGFNHFQEMWEKAVDSPTQRAIFVGWWRHDHYAYAQTHPYFPIYMPDGRDTTLTPLERKRARMVKETYGFTITPEQIAWYRWKLDEECDGDQMKMDEMFPWMPEDAFVATGSKFFTNESLTDAMRIARGSAFRPFRYILTRQWNETECVALKDAKRADLKVWEFPDPEGHYTIGCDPSYGSSDEADRNVISVFRCFADCQYQVAEFCSSIASTYHCAWVLAHLSGLYRNVMVNLETNGPGKAVLGELDELRMKAQQMLTVPDGEEHQGGASVRSCLQQIRYFIYRRPDSMSSGQGFFHWQTNASTKAPLMNRFKDSFDLQLIKIRSLYCLEEMKSIVTEEGQIHAQGRGHDDRVIGAALAHEAWKRWVQPKLMMQGLTLAKAMRDGERQMNKTQKQLEDMAINYLKTVKIGVPMQ